VKQDAIDAPVEDGLFTFGTLDFSTFTATLSLLDQRGDTEVISSPRITTLNNQKATIKVIDKIMLQKTQETTQTAGIVTVEFEDESEAREVGVKLTVIPHVNDEGDISVNLLPEVSTDAGFTTQAVAGGTQSTVALTISSREANTTIRVRDGDTIFIGGLIKSNIEKTENKVPLLGDLFGGIPIIGNVFKYEAEEITRNEIAFFVTVHLVRESTDAARAAGEMARYEQFYLSDKGNTGAEEKEEGHSGKKGRMAGKKTGKRKTSVVTASEAVEGKKEYAPLLDFRKKEKKTKK
jgi:type II secretory pathway component GspD/PulD (secretin)